MFIWSPAAGKLWSVTGCCRFVKERKKDVVMKSCMWFGWMRLLMYPFPLALLAPAGCLTEHCNSWHCTTCLWKRLVSMHSTAGLLIPGLSGAFSSLWALPLPTCAVSVLALSSHLCLHLPCRSGWMQALKSSFRMQFVWDA